MERKGLHSAALHQVNPLCSSCTSKHMRPPGSGCAGSQVIFRLRRPFYLINSSMHIENGEGEVGRQTGMLDGSN